MIRAIAARLLLTVTAAVLPWGACRAEVLPHCAPEPTLSAAQQDILFRLGALIKAELDGLGTGAVLVSRSGLDLGRLGVRYSHAGVALRASRHAPWAVRQLYYACDERAPRLFDQGLPGFLTGTDEPDLGFVSVVALPQAQAAALESRALDDRRALELLGAAYSANAHPFSQRYQNCNQWVVELLASAWQAPDDGTFMAPRARAQRWLAEQGYQPSVFDAGAHPWLAIGALFVPWLHRDDHPGADLDAAVYRVSMPDAIEAFVRERLPDAMRIEFCHAGRQVVVHRGWDPVAPGCRPGPGDTVITLAEEGTHFAQSAVGPEVE